jgi:hypothetical protein
MDQPYLVENVFEHSGEDSVETRHLESELRLTRQCKFHTQVGGFDRTRTNALRNRLYPPARGSTCGADARFTIPLFLLPNHEHILPPIPTAQDEKKLKQKATDYPSKTTAQESTKRRGQRHDVSLCQFTGFFRKFP